jgi:site-specific DNA recombinase
MKPKSITTTGLPLKRKSGLPWFAYVRVSTREQGDNFSPAKQIEAILAWTRQNGVTVPGLESAIISPREIRGSEYVGFDVMSGKSMDKRTDFQRAIDMAKAGKIGGMIAYRLDRVARNVIDAHMLRARLKTMRAGLEFASQKFDDSPMGEMMYTIYAQFAAMEGQLIIERTSNGRLGRVRDQKKCHSGGSVLYGYRMNAEGKLEIWEPEAAVVRRIFDLAKDGASAYSIMVLLNREGILTRKGHRWWRESVTQILQKADRYAGTWTIQLGIEAAKKEWKKHVEMMGDSALPIDLSNVTAVELDIVPLIDPETARIVKARRTKNRQVKAGRPATRSLLSKLIFCPVCGKRWYALSKGQNHKRRYRCCRRVFVDSRQVWCAGGEIACDRLDAVVLRAMGEYLQQPRVAFQVAQQAYEEEHGSAARLKRADDAKRLDGLKGEQSHFEGILMNPALKKLHAKATTRFSELEIEICELERELRRTPVTVMYSADQIAREFRAKLKALDAMETFEEKREFLESTVERIMVQNGEITISGTIALPNEATGGNWKSGVGADAEGERENRCNGDDSAAAHGSPAERAVLTEAAEPAPAPFVPASLLDLRGTAEFAFCQPEGLSAGIALALVLGGQFVKMVRHLHLQLGFFSTAEEGHGLLLGFRIRVQSRPRRHIASTGQFRRGDRFARRRSVSST